MYSHKVIKSEIIYSAHISQKLRKNA